MPCVVLGRAAGWLEGRGRTKGRSRRAVLSSATLSRTTVMAVCGVSRGSRCRVPAMSQTHPGAERRPRGQGRPCAARCPCERPNGRLPKMMLKETRPLSVCINAAGRSKPLVTCARGGLAGPRQPARASKGQLTGICVSHLIHAVADRNRKARLTWSIQTRACVRICCVCRWVSHACGKRSG